MLNSSRLGKGGGGLAFRIHMHKSVHGGAVVVYCCLLFVWLVFGVVILAFSTRVEHCTPRCFGVVVSFSGFGFSVSVLGFGWVETVSTLLLRL